jgi:hypothetical protein
MEKRSSHASWMEYETGGHGHGQRGQPCDRPRDKAIVFQRQPDRSDAGKNYGEPKGIKIPAKQGLR